MKRINKILATSAVALGLVTTVALAASEGGHGAGQGMGAMGGMGGMGGMGMMHGGEHGSKGMGMEHGGRMGQGPAVMSEQHLSSLKAQLAITPQQESAWQAFSTKAAEQAKLMQASRTQRHQTTDTTTTTAAPDRMARHIDTMTQHLAGMQSVNAAMKDLYAALTPEQRKIADQQFDHRGRGAMGRGMHS